MSDIRVEEIDGTTVATVVPAAAPPPSTPKLPLESAEAPASPEAAAAPAAEEPAAPEGDEAQEPEPKPEKKTSYQSRIDRLTRERYEAEARAKLLEEELERLRQPQEPAPQPVADVRPERGDFPDDDQYIAALVEYQARQAMQPLLAQVQSTIETVSAERARVEARQQYRERVEAVRSELPDFDAVTSQNLPLSPVMHDLIVESPAGPRIAYYLGSHPEECVALSKLPPVAAARAMGVLEARLGTAPTGPVSQATRSAAPPPVKPVGGAPTAAASSLYDTNISQREWERIRNQQELDARRSR